ncbi:hypothetical protein CspeluHIS016_0109960 [Cutaneotrichosporon spelunceum]|uniref:Glycosyltransferase 61 catalytic domain-containing protein n=1 Tax=Cutaneotrichosporon spelunceum TaxID=1672016 RepID=A0AAD3Y8P7_9TREE|nr:hypothetical protein CspeluHIS016_0109960 [Cutaneotrichosporon spelunceum]
MAYVPLATDEQPTYPPSSPNTPSRRWPRGRLLLGLLAVPVLVHYGLLLTSAPDPQPSVTWVRPSEPAPPSPPLGQGSPYRDPTPIASAQYFLSLAEEEVKALGLDTCGDEVGRAMVRAAAKRRLVYCSSPSYSSETEGAGAEAVSNLDLDLDPEKLAAAADRPARIECMPLRSIGKPGLEGPNPELHSMPSWWPITSAPCVSRNLRPVARINQRNFLARCEVTNVGKKLNKVAAEAFVGSMIVPEQNETCRSILGHTVMFVQRMDVWNPFHIAEDLITTLLSLLIVGEAVPELQHHRIQLAFLDHFGIDSRFEGVWDRMGALPPRRTSHEPFDDGVCLNTAIHGMYGRTSLLSASGLWQTYGCASTVSWAAAHYYRHLFGLAPLNNTEQRPINILYVSRMRLRHHLKGDVSEWQKYRELKNEDEMLARWRVGLREMCADCEFIDANAQPERWAQPSGSRREVRFAAIDPVAYSLESQVHLVGHATLLVGQHGGALGLSLFLPPGRGAVLEFLVPMVKGNNHFQHMAVQMGHKHRYRPIDALVDVERAWNDLKEMVEEIMVSEAPKSVP